MIKQFDEYGDACFNTYNENIQGMLDDIMNSYGTYSNQDFMNVLANTMSKHFSPFIDSVGKVSKCQRNQFFPCKCFIMAFYFHKISLLGNFE